MSSSTPDRTDSGAKRRDSVRNTWRKQIECEERGKFWRKMIDCGAGVRELESIGEKIKDKFRSDKIKSRGREREVVKLVMSLRLKDERKHQIELKRIHQLEPRQTLRTLI